MNVSDFLTLYITGTILSNDPLYNLVELRDTLMNTNEAIKDDDCLLTPFYVSRGKKYELYVYELVVEKGFSSFGDRVIKQSGIQALKDYTEAYRSIRNNCTYSNCTQKELIDWSDYLLNNNEMKKEIESVFGEVFVPTNMYFAIY